MSTSAFGVDHGEVSKSAMYGAGRFATGASAKVVGQLGRSGARGDKQIATNMISRGIQNIKPTSGAHERALNSGAQRAGALRGRLQYRENYPDSKRLNGFPKKALP